MVHTVWILLSHYIYAGGVEFFADIGDHFVTHYVVIVVVKIGAAHVVAIIAHKVHKTRKAKNDNKEMKIEDDKDIAA